ncbi:hypothetical protein [Mycobacterium marinum]|uniref:hypothetical protein n=1 Tax=Mycobacterium marinum TaxID=1781 RepID=UPI00235983B9|nr:hypothetical protein [Mycobacterium marinum]MDC8981246.1 hypothetical protein [Mycobacterium marinum]
MNTSSNGDDQVAERVRELLRHAVAALTPNDYTARVTHCRDHNEHGIRMHFDGDDLIEFRWGGRRLALCHRNTLLNDNGPFQFELVNDQPIPDTIPDEWTQQ